MSLFLTTILLATQAATELSRETGSELHVVYVLPTPPQLIGHLYSDDVRESLIGGAERDAGTFLKEQADQIASDGGKVAETHLRSGDPDKEILRAAESLGVGLIVVGSRGLGALSRALMGPHPLSGQVRHLYHSVEIDHIPSGAAAAPAGSSALSLSLQWRRRDPGGSRCPPPRCRG
jgi:nucleotide-binding universal stress UspA family protein